MAPPRQGQVEAPCAVEADPAREAARVALDAAADEEGARPPARLGGAQSYERAEPGAKAGEDGAAGEAARVLDRVGHGVSPHRRR